MNTKGVGVCEVCGVAFAKRGQTQRYCAPCSEGRDLERKKLWVRANPPSAARKARNGELAVVRKELAREAGAAASRESALDITWDGGAGPSLLWLVRVAVPFTYAHSKNHLYTNTRNGHVALRRESVAARQGAIAAIRIALAGRKIANNKLWVEMLVQKPNHKGDAINVMDSLADAIKVATGLDDRWFCVRRIDWQIVRENPQVFIGLGQESDEDCHVCSYCGSVKPFASFNKAKDQPLGIGRECRDCRTAGRKIAKARTP